jgi:hypothetical protein
LPYGGVDLTSIAMRNDLRQRIESELSLALESGLATEEVLAEAAGLLSEAESLVSRLSDDRRPRRRPKRKRRKD